MISNTNYSSNSNSEQMSPIPNALNIGVTPLIPLAEICKVGIMPESLLAEAKPGVLDVIVIGNDCYFRSQQISEFFQKKFSQPIDNLTSTELSCQSEPKKEVDSMVERMRTKFTFSKVHKPNGIRYYAQCSTTEGKNTRISKCFRTEKEANDFIEKMNAQFKMLHEKKPNLEIMGSVPKKWWKADKAIDWFLKNYNFTCNTVTLKGYSDVLKLFMKSAVSLGFNDIKLEDLTLGVCQKVLKKIADEKSQQTVNKCRITLQMLIRYMYREEILSGKDFSADIASPKAKKESKSREIYTTEEIELLKNKALECDDKFIYTVICILASTGIRPEELGALTWDNIDMDRMTLTVKNAVVKVNDSIGLYEKSKTHWEIGKTKSKTGVRTLALNKCAIFALKEWRKEADSMPMGKDTEFVFFKQGGSFLSGDELRTKWKKFIKKSGLTGKNYIMYRFRHTFCTKLLLNNVAPAKVQSAMGDSTLDVIMKIYNHLQSEDIIEEIRAVI